MTRKSQTAVILCMGMLLSLLISSCGGLKKEQVQKQTDTVDAQAQAAVEAGEFQKAIDFHGEAFQKQPQDPAVVSGYIQRLESIKNRGDQAFEKKDFKSAGNIYEILAKNWVRFADFSQCFSFDKTFLEKKIKTCRCLFAEEQLPAYLKAGEFRRAVEVSREIYQKYSRDPAIQKCYIRTLESIKSAGDQAFKRKDFGLAGCVYEVLLRNISSTKQLNGIFSFNQESLTAKLGSCRKILFQNGLEQYRSGNLNQAIALWKSILVFDPENQEIRKAVDMATLQVKNLKDAKQKKKPAD